MVAVDTFDFFVSVPRPERPKNEVGPISDREEREPIDPSVLPDPVTSLNVIRMGIFREARRFSLLGREETLLLLRSLEEAPGCIKMRLSHSTILQIYCSSVKIGTMPLVSEQAAMPNTMPTSSIDLN